MEARKSTNEPNEAGGTERGATPRGAAALGPRREQCHHCDMEMVMAMADIRGDRAVANGAEERLSRSGRDGPSHSADRSTKDRPLKSDTRASLPVSHWAPTTGEPSQATCQNTSVVPPETRRRPSGRSERGRANAKALGGSGAGTRAHSLLLQRRCGLWLYGDPAVAYSWAVRHPSKYVPGL